MPPCTPCETPADAEVHKSPTSDRALRTGTRPGDEERSGSSRSGPGGPAIALSIQTCAYHPDRVGQALCMRCRRVICQECALTWDGVNHCRPCLELRRGQARRGRSWLRWVGWAAITSALFLATGWAMAWSVGLWARRW